LNAVKRLLPLVIFVILCAGCEHFAAPDLRPGVDGKDFGYPEMWRRPSGQQDGFTR
jgi:hypothetical protein